MTYYRFNTKFIDSMEREITQERSKAAVVVLRSIDIMLAAAVIISLLVKQYVIAIIFFWMLASSWWNSGPGDRAYRKRYEDERQWYLSTITLDDEEILLHDGDGQLDRRIPYSELVGMEQIMMPAIVTPFIRGAKRQHPIVREEMLFICLYADNRNIRRKKTFEDHWEDRRVILFPFYRSAWDMLERKVPVVKTQVKPAE